MSDVRLTISGRRLGHIHDQMRAGECAQDCNQLEHSRAVDMLVCEFFLCPSDIDSMGGGGVRYSGDSPCAYSLVESGGKGSRGGGDQM